MTRSAAGDQPLTSDELHWIDAYWRAANYLSVGQIYLLDNPLLREPLGVGHIKPRLLGHWGTTPGLNFIYVHLNRIITRHALDMIYIAGPGHGGPAVVANTYLEGTYSELYPEVSQDAAGMRRLFKQFSFPGGIPSHAAPEVPGSINEGGELGYSLAHAFGAAFDNPGLIVACVVGDGEAETGPLAAAWHSNKFLNPLSDGMVLPILHLNGYKIASPTVLARIGDDELESLYRGYGYEPHLVDGSHPNAMHQRMAATLEAVVARLRTIRARAEATGGAERPRWPMIILRTPKGWTGAASWPASPGRGCGSPGSDPPLEARGSGDPDPHVSLRAAAAAAREAGIDTGTALHRRARHGADRRSADGAGGGGAVALRRRERARQNARPKPSAATYPPRSTSVA